MRTIKVVPYNTLWAADFESEAPKIKAIAPDLIQSVHHIGSTAVPGLAAKPIIDILLEVTDIARLDAYNPDFEALGYEPKGEYGIPGRRYFPKGGDRRTHHIHAFETGSPDTIRHLAFRDYLQRFPDIRDEYAQVKQRAAIVCNHDIDRYMAEKNDFILFHQHQAVQMYTVLKTNCQIHRSAAK